MSDLSTLPPAERIARYRELAKQAQRDAERSKGDVRAAFENIAQGWERLADITEEVIAARVSAPAEQGIEQKEAALRTPKPDEPDDPNS